MSNDIDVTYNRPVYYKYNVVCNNKTVVLNVENTDLIYNADGEVDCPLDVVLRKNQYSFQDLMNWGSKYLHFVEIDGERKDP